MKSKAIKLILPLLAVSFCVPSGVAFVSQNSGEPLVQIKKLTTSEDNITMGDIYNYLSKKEEHYPISDSFIEQYQQASGGYIDYAKKTGHTVDKTQHEPNQKWHFFNSWLYQSIDDGTLKWDELAKSRVYTKLLCPELLLWIYEACGVESTKVSQAYDVAVEGKQNGTTTTTIAKNMRSVVAWSDLAGNILSGLSEGDPYHVTPAVGDGYTISGLSYDGYAVGATVSFTLTMTDSMKVLQSVSVDGNALTPVSEGHYQFVMPSKNAVITVATTDKEVDPGPDPSQYLTAAILDFPVSGQKSVSTYTATWNCSNSGYDFEISHASNNRNGWSYIALGMKAANNTAYIANTTAISETIDAIKLNISAYKSSGVEAAKIVVANNASFENGTEIDIKDSIPGTNAPGEVVVEIPEAKRLANGFYKIQIDTNYSPNANGFIHIDDISYLFNKPKETENFVSEYLHMTDYKEELGYCKDAEHGYYALAKTAFNGLSEYHRSLIINNIGYYNERARLLAWASANGDSFVGNELASSAFSTIKAIKEDSSSYASLLILSMGLLAGTSFICLRKRKEK